MDNSREGMSHHTLPFCACLTVDIYSARVETALRQGLLPRLANSSLESLETIPVGLSHGAFGHAHAPGFAGADTNGVAQLPIGPAQPGLLNKLQELLLRGEKQQAYTCALDERLWAHAMIISSGVSREAFQGVVDEFIKAELKGPATSSDDRASLRVAYSLFSGHSAAARK